MSVKPAKLFPKAKPKTHDQSMSLFRKRQTQRGVNWVDIDVDQFLFFLGNCVRENIGIGIYSASGGRGICMKLYTGKKVPDQEYADNADEFNELIRGVMENLEWVADDLEEEEAAD